MVVKQIKQSCGHGCGGGVILGCEGGNGVMNNAYIYPNQDSNFETYSPPAHIFHVLNFFSDIHVKEIYHLKT